MSYRSTWEPGALAQLTRLIETDPEGVAAIFKFVDTNILTDPRAVKAFSYGPDTKRVRLGIYRITYDIHDDIGLVAVTNVAKSLD